MSLINDMLKDLDAQRTRPNAANASALQGLGLTGPAGNMRDYKALALYGCGLVLVTVLALPWAMQVIKQPAASRTAALVIPEQLTQTVRVKPAAPAGKDTPKTADESAAVQETPPAAATVTTADAVNTGQQTEAEPSDIAQAHTGPVAAQKETEQPGDAQSLQAAGQQITIVERPLTPEQQQQNAYRNALAAVRTGNYVEAETLLTTGLALNPRHAPFAILYAQLLVAQTREQEAIQRLQTALPGAGQDAEYHAYLAALYQRTGKPAAAARLYEIALRNAPAKGEWWMGLGISQEQSANLPAAYAAYQRALQYPLKPALQQYIQTRLKILSRRS